MYTYFHTYVARSHSMVTDITIMNCYNSPKYHAMPYMETSQCSPAAPAGIRSHNLSITTPALYQYQQAIPAPREDATNETLCLSLFLCLSLSLSVSLRLPVCLSLSLINAIAGRHDMLYLFVTMCRYPPATHQSFKVLNKKIIKK